MNKLKTNRIWLALTILALGALACQFGGDGPVVTPAPVQTEPTTAPTENGGLSSEDRTNLLNATVQVLMQIQQGDEFVSFSGGSGTIISADGLILTNAHVASPASQGDPDNEPDRLVISLIESEDKPPVPSYIAIVKAVDGYLDLAVLQIISTVDGSSVDAADLNLPFVELGNPDEIHIGEHLNIIGFPSIGGETVTYTDGNVSGFASADQIGDRAWIKTDATISGGNSGGLAADDNGQIVGVPTSLGASGSGMDCRPQQDTNDNGELDDGDFCVPISNFIADVRPINFAKPLIQAADGGKEYASPYRLPGQVTEAGSGEEAVTDFVWFDTSNSKDTCENTGDGVGVDSYPANALCIWTYFNYSGLTDGQQIRELWYNNAETVGEATYSWESGPEGSIGTFLGNAGDPMPAGEYYLEMYAGDDDHVIGTSGKVVVGDGSGGGTSQPAQEDTVTVYGVIFDADTKKPINGAYVFVAQGVTYEEWQSENFADKYLIAGMQVDKTGKYEILDVPRDIPFTYVFSAEGYYDSWLDDAVIPIDDPARRFELNAEMSK
jgi:S1-C subfamily serine protease